MVLLMNNNEVLLLLDECQDDLDKVGTIIDSLGQTSSVVPYLSKYAIIKACGTIEVAYKTIIADNCSKRTKKQVKTFIDNKVRDSSHNPSYTNICNLLDEFDSDWKDNFKQQVQIHTDRDEILTSLSSLVAARNEFAHGGNPTITISDVIRYYRFCRIVIEIIDNVVA